ncbi:MAG: efflux RND transporter periplasmic adaptor subunit [Planctomycetes bacterium]|nr:efflux RND transporter periplasmic adaptor subunit [Planctomycetota bacterium]
MTLIKRLLLALSLQLVIIPFIHAQEGPPASTVSVAEIISEDIKKSIDIIGHVKAKRESKLGLDVSGLVKNIHFFQGMSVKKNQELLSLDNHAINLEIKILEAKIQELIYLRDQAQREEERSQKLHQAKHLSREAYEKDKSKLTSLAQQLLQTQSQCALLKWKAKQHILKAPFAGLLSSQNHELGSWYQTGQPVTTLLDLSSVYVEVEMPEIYLSRLDRSATLTVSSDAWPNLKQQAKLEAILPGKGDGSRSVLLRYICPNPEQKLLPHLSLKLKLPLKTIKNALLVPKDSIVSQGPLKIIFVVKDNRAKQVIVNILDYHKEYARIKAEVAAKDKIVIRGNEFLFDGAPLNIVTLPSEKGN